MPLKHTRTYMALGLLLLLSATPAFGQGPQGMQIFALDDESTYGGAPEPKEGYFFSYDGLYWMITSPHTHSIGYPGTRNVSYGTSSSDVRTEYNTLDTSVLSGQFSIGNRFEFGRIEDRNGWFVSFYQLRDQSQSYTAASADIVFNDPDNGPSGGGLLTGNVNTNTSSSPPYTPAVIRNLPTVFANVTMQEIIKTWGVEANYIHRFMTNHNGGTFDLFLGPRYIQFDDTFNVTTGADPGTLTVPSFLGGSYWDTEAQNHIAAGQIGLRWFKKQGRWTFNTEGRFLAGLNCQNLRQVVDIGPNLNPGVNSDGSYTPFQPTRLGHESATYVAYEREFTPGAELRLEFRYQITNAICAHAGWSGLWMGNIARASSVIDYTIANDEGRPMGINTADNKENVFVNGLTIGVDINR
ncbi:MAG: BBP7 family outer membrane beta-barrel protein [Thermoguttaceae bacterium]